MKKLLVVFTKEPSGWLALMQENLSSAKPDWVDIVYEKDAIYKMEENYADYGLVLFLNYRQALHVLSDPYSAGSNQYPYAVWIHNSKESVPFHNSAHFDDWGVMANNLFANCVGTTDFIRSSWGLESFTKIAFPIFKEDSPFSYWENKEKNSCFVVGAAFNDPIYGLDMLDDVAKANPEINFYAHAHGETKVKNVHYIGTFSGEKYQKTLRRYEYTLSLKRCETLGISQLEAVRYGAIPLMPFDGCYPEIYKGEFLYDIRPNFKVRGTHADLSDLVSRYTVQNTYSDLKNLLLKNPKIFKL